MLTIITVTSQGACNAVLRLPEEVAHKGAVTHSSGNHAAAVARAAQVSCTVTDLAQTFIRDLYKRCLY